jgi:hypothetical protein
MIDSSFIIMPTFAGNCLQMHPIKHQTQEVSSHKADKATLRNMLLLCEKNGIINQRVEIGRKETHHIIFVVVDTCCFNTTARHAARIILHLSHETATKIEN